MRGKLNSVQNLHYIFVDYVAQPCVVKLEGSGQGSGFGNGSQHNVRRSRSWLVFSLSGPDYNTLPHTNIPAVRNKSKARSRVSTTSLPLRRTRFPELLHHFLSLTHLMCRESLVDKAHFGQVLHPWGHSGQHIHQLNHAQLAFVFLGLHKVKQKAFLLKRKTRMWGKPWSRNSHTSVRTA